MAFIGNQPTAVPLTSSQLADGLITTAKLATDAVTSAKIADGAIVNVDVNSTAAVAYSKLNLATSIVNADISASAAIATTKLGAGAVLQVAQSTFTSSGGPSLTSTTFVAFSSVTISITPSSASNKVLILLATNVYAPAAGTSFLTIAKGSTNLGGSKGFSQKSTANWAGATMVYLDSPSTTSSITYSLYARVDSGEGFMYGDSGNVNTITAFEIAG